jgi:hypothetical protein
MTLPIKRANGRLVFHMRPRTVKLRVEAQRLENQLKAEINIQEPDPDIKAELQDALGELAVLVTYTAAIEICDDTENQFLTRFGRWWESRNTDDAKVHFEEFISTPESILNEWVGAYVEVNGAVLPIETKPPSALSAAERVELADPKVVATKKGGDGK